MKKYPAILVILCLALLLSLLIVLGVNKYNIASSIAEIIGIEDDRKDWKTETIADDFTRGIVAVAVEQTTQKVVYDPAYFQIDYPNGDVPPDRGVCTDVIIRAYRPAGIDLQKEVHEDMVKNFELYPNKWGLTGTDTNIDHRRVPNLQVFFKRFGEELEINKNPESYRPGDIVTWNMPQAEPISGWSAILPSTACP